MWSQIHICILLKHLFIPTYWCEDILISFHAFPMKFYENLVTRYSPAIIERENHWKNSWDSIVFQCFFFFLKKKVQKRIIPIFSTYLIRMHCIPWLVIENIHKFKKSQHWQFHGTHKVHHLSVEKYMHTNEISWIDFVQWYSKFPKIWRVYYKLPLLNFR